jgi:hypothetical protein
VFFKHIIAEFAQYSESPFVQLRLLVWNITQEIKKVPENECRKYDNPTNVTAAKYVFDLHFLGV